MAESSEHPEHFDVRHEIDKSFAEGSPSTAYGAPISAVQVTSEIIDASLQEDGELEQHAQTFKIILMRHGTPYRPGVVPNNPEDVARLGKLTEQGVEEAKATAERIAEDALNDGRPTSFFILGSPTPYYIDGQAFAERSMETAQVARQTIQEYINTKHLTPEQADIHIFGSEIDALENGSVGARSTKPLSEPDFYAVKAPNGEYDYRYANAVREHAKEDGSIDKYGGSGHLEPWLRSDPSLEGLRKEVGAQSAPEVAIRVMKFMGVLERYARLWQKTHEDRQMVFILASHGEIMRTVLQHGFGAEENAQGKVYGMAEAMPIDIKNGKAKTIFNDKPYEVSL